MDTHTTLYEQDFYAWAQHQATLIRQGKWRDIDQERVAEEIEALSRRERHALRSRLIVLLMHLLQWRYQPDWQIPSWRYTIRDQRLAIADLLADSPSLRNEGATVLKAAYQHARLCAANETRLPEVTFPEGCPWTFGQVLDDSFWSDMVKE
jgi:hypothetical protein